MSECGALTGCEKHIARENHERDLTETDRQRTHDQYMQPLLNKQLGYAALSTTGPGGHVQGHAHTPSHHGCCGGHGDGDSDGDGAGASHEDGGDAAGEDDVGQLRERRRLQMKAEWEAKRQPLQQTTHVLQVNLENLKRELHVKETIVVCALLSDDESRLSQYARLALDAIERRNYHIKCMACVMPHDKLGLSAELGWSMVYVSNLPEIICYYDGTYVTHHGGLHKTADQDSVLEAVDRWFGKAKQRLQAYAPRNKFCNRPWCGQDETHQHHDSDDEEETLDMGSRLSINFVAKDVAKEQASTGTDTDTSDDDAPSPGGRQPGRSSRARSILSASISRSALDSDSD